MNKNTALLSLIALTLSSACSKAPPQEKRAASILSQAMTDAVMYGTVGDGRTTASFHFKDDPWLGEVSGQVNRSGMGYEDERFDLELEAFGDEGETFTGDMELNTYVDSDLGYRTLYLTGEVLTSTKGQMDVDLEIDFEEEHSFFSVEWVGEINGIEVSGEMMQRDGVGDPDNDCRVPIGVDCG